jgi:NADPH-ferrihemoprotein reductase
MKQFVNRYYVHRVWNILISSKCVFISSGEPTDNSAEFMEWIKSPERSGEDSVANVPYAVFALGNRQYEHFCAVGRVLDERVAELGGIRVVDHGEGDDDGSLEDDYSNWKKDFWSATHAKFGSKSADDEIKANEMKKFESSYTVNVINDAAEQSAYNGGINNLVTDTKHRVVKARVIVNKELRSSNAEGSTKHLEFDVSNLKFSYVTADNLGVYPRNDYKLTDKIIKRLGLDRNNIFRIKAKAGKKSPFPNPCSVEDAFLWYLDYNYSPRLTQLPILAQYATAEKDKLGLLAYANEKREEYVADHKSLYEVLEEFPSVQPPLADLLDFIPKLAPRYYTISSSSLVNPNVISITVALTVHNKPRNRQSLGIASSYLANLKAGKDLAAIFIRPSSFRFPKPKLLANVNISAAESKINNNNPSNPIIMIGPGTGKRQFLLHFDHQQLS